MPLLVCATDGVPCVGLRDTTAARPEQFCRDRRFGAETLERWVLSAEEAVVVARLNDAPDSVLIKRTIAG